MAGRRAARALTRNSPVTLYEQLATELRNAIVDGRFAPGARLPNEDDLGRLYGVSRITTRQALDRLCQQGLIARKQGKGTFVSGPLVRHDLLDMRGIHAEMLGQGLQGRLLDFGVGPAPEPVASQLATDGRAVAHWRRLYTLRGKPFSLSSAYLAVSDERVTDAVVAKLPTYAVIESVLRLRIGHAEIAIRSRSADRAMRSLLQLARNEPLMVFERVSFLTDGRPAEHTLYYARAEAYEFSLTVRGKLPITAAFKGAASESGGQPRSPAAVQG
jgi:GntR family transcriptional regulator